MARFTQQSIDEVRAAVDIVKVIANYVVLEPAGKRLKGLCPFHTEKTPSFTVDPEEQLYYCFGCHAGGNVFTFLMQVERVSFVDAVQQLATQAGIALSGEEDPKRQAADQRRAALLQANEVAATYFMQALRSPEGATARKYLATRHVSEEMLAKFRLGFSPSGWRGLADTLVRHRVDEQVAIEAGLLSPGRDGGRPYDRFRGRIMFPICDENGKVVGFGGRSLDGSEPKYLNTSETPLFHKGRMLYGLHHAKEAIRREGQALLVEGYLDVISLTQYGIEWAVAPLGTAVTEEQGRLLRRFCSEVIVAFDGDPSGQRAAERAFSALGASGLKLRVLTLPNPHDPDTFIRQAGKETFLQLVTDAFPVIEFRLRQVLQQFDLATTNGRIAAGEQLLTLLASVDSPVERELYLQRVAGWLGVSHRALSESLARRMAPQAAPLPAASISRHIRGTKRYTRGQIKPNGESGKLLDRSVSLPTTSQLDSNVLVERALLRLLMEEPEWASKVKDVLGTAPFADNRYNEIFRSLSEAHNADQAISSLTDPDAAALASDIMLNEPVPQYGWQECMGRLIAERFRKTCRRIASELEDTLRAPAHELCPRTVALAREYRNTLKQWRPWLLPTSRGERV